MSKDYKTIHNGDRLTDECRTLANSNSDNHGSIWESEKMGNNIRVQALSKMLYYNDYRKL